MTTSTPATSPLVLGAMMFGTTIDETTSFALLDRFVERGGVWIDTADCYSFWATRAARAATASACWAGDSRSGPVCGSV